MRRRTATLATAIALAATALVGTAHAATVDDPSAPVTTTQSGSYWACVAVDHVHVGACLENPLPDLSDYGTLRGVIREHTGVRVP